VLDFNVMSKINGHELSLICTKYNEKYDQQKIFKLLKAETIPLVSFPNDFNRAVGTSVVTDVFILHNRYSVFFFRTIKISIIEPLFRGFCIIN